MRIPRTCFSSVLAALAVLSCRTVPPAPDPGLSLSLSEPELRAVSVETLEFSCMARIGNGGGETAFLDVVGASLSLDGLNWRTSGMPGRRELKPGEELVVPLGFSLPMPRPADGPAPTSAEAPSEAMADWSLTAMVQASDGEVPYTLTEGRSGRVPRIGIPSFTVASIAIRQGDLVNTRLLVTLDIRNPNAFPVSLEGYSYELYGEGRYWASGKLARPDPLPPLSSTRVVLELSMNFTTMNRQVLDQVLKLERVSYRLAGSVTVDLGLELLPPFNLPFDLAGSVAVAR